MSGPNDYIYWYSKAIKVFTPHSIPSEISEYTKYTLKLNPFHLDSWIIYTGYHNILGYNN